MRTPVALLFCLSLASYAQLPSNLYDALQWRLIGPFRGGRAIAVTGVPGDPNTFYFGAVAGGVWKSTDAGDVWRPIFDHEHIASIGAIAVAPSDHNVIYVGSGEADMRSDITFGNGMYKSTDAGRTWTHIGLTDSQQIARILVDPKNPDLVYVAALGHAYGPNEERGVYRSTDGGATWTKVLDKGPSVGAVDLAMEPENPKVVYATMWNAHRPPWSQYPPVEGPGSGLYKSTDGGDSWVQIAGHGLPEDQWGRSGVAIAPGTHGRCVYAVIDAKQAGLYRSDDSGKTWTWVGKDRRVDSRAWYFSEVTVDPHDSNIVYLPNVNLYKSVDGGQTFTILRGAPGGDDYHALWVDPTDSSRMILGSDQGVSISLDDGVSWSTWNNQPTAQFYHVAVDNQFPYWVYGAQQDSGAMAVPSRTNGGDITDYDWRPIGGGESGYIAPDPKDARIVYVGNSYGELARFDTRTWQSQNITPWPAPAFGTDINARKYRFPWTSPLLFSKTEPNALYFGAQYLLKTTDGGLHWHEVSPDLTGDTRKKGDDTAPEGPLSIDNAKQRGYGVLYTVAPSPMRAGLIWVGSDTGLIHLTRDDGKTWTDVTPPSVSNWSKIAFIAASHFDPAEAWAVVDRHRLDDFSPHLLRTRDYGKTWTAVTNGIEAPAFLRAVREDPVRRGLLFAGTEMGVYVSFDDGDHWQPLQLNLPVTSIRDLAIHGTDLIVATHGRGFWILDDITPLREASAKIAESTAYLYRPAKAIRTSSAGFTGTPMPIEMARAKNPPEGAMVDYYLKSGGGEVTLEFLDGANHVIRRISSNEKPMRPRGPLTVADVWVHVPPPLTANAGMNRFVWDLRYPVVGAGGRGRGATGPQVLPGAYKVKLTVDGTSYTQPLTVAMDPRIAATPEDLALQHRLGLRALGQLREAHETSGQVQRLRAQIAELKKSQASGSWTQPASSLDQQAAAIAEALASSSRDFGVVLGVVNSADRRPPEQAFELDAQAAKKVAAENAKWTALKGGAVTRLNDLLRSANLPPLKIAGN
jgi:photosystem II stability/assembly factor-like uncharacterized protein